MTDNLILYCGIGFALSLLCNAALVAWIIFGKENFETKSNLQKYYLGKIQRLEEEKKKVEDKNFFTRKYIEGQRDRYKAKLRRANEKINQQLIDDNKIAQWVDEYDSEIERLKKLVKPQDAIEADFGPQLDDDETIETTDFSGDDELLGLVEESDGETIEADEKESDNNESSKVQN